MVLEGYGIRKEEYRASTVLFRQNVCRNFKDNTNGVAFVMLYIDFMAVPDNNRF